MSTCLEQEVSTIDPKVLKKAMGGSNPPEEPLLAATEDGYGYFTSAAVGNALDSYRFLRKLGWAGSSSVWLVLDTSKDEETPELVALKILTASATASIVGGLSPEYEVFRKIESANPNHPGFQHCLTLKGCFTAKSGAGGHICFATDVLSTSLANLRPPGRDTFTIPLAKRIIKQVLLALDYLHRECGYIHTDLKSENILAKIPDPAVDRIKKYLNTSPPSIYGPPLKLKSCPVPVAFSRSQPLPYFELGASVDDISVRVVDYDQATPADKPERRGLRQPDLLRSPEVTLQYPWTSAIDIWTVGCLLFELVTNHQLFNIPDYSPDTHLQYIAEYLGPFPPSFLEKCTERAKYFDEKGDLLRTDEFTPCPLEQILKELEAADEADIPSLAAFMRQCLTLDPALRPSAQELLRDDWLSGGV